MPNISAFLIPLFVTTGVISLLSCDVSSGWAGSCLTFSPLSEVKWSESLSRVRHFATPWTVAYQAPPSMGFSRQEYQSGLPFPSPGDLPDPGIKPGSPAFQGDALTSEPPGKPYIYIGLSSSNYTQTLLYLMNICRILQWVHFIVCFYSEVRSYTVNWKHEIKPEVCSIWISITFP